MSKVEWLCARCAKKESKETEPDPTVLRLCTSCKVENWVRPFAHFGEAAEPTPEEVEEAKAFHEQKLKVLKKATANRKEKAAEEYKEAEKEVLEAETVPEPELEVVAVIVEGELKVIDEDSEIVDPKEAEIARLKAELAELEK